MNDFITKYLVVKMLLGYGYSATEEEITKVIEYLKQRNIEVENSYNKKFIKKKNDKYYALYTLSKSAITIDQIEFYKIISEFIKNNIIQEKIDRNVFDLNSFYRAQEISMHLVIALNSIAKAKSKRKKCVLYKIDEEEIIAKQYTPLFNSLVVLIGSLLEKGKKEDLQDYEELKIISVDPTKIISSYKSYCNFRILDNELNNVLSSHLKFNYELAIIFGSDTYYGLRGQAEHDYIFVSRDSDIYGPFYNLSYPKENRLTTSLIKEEIPSQKLLYRILNNK